MTAKNVINKTFYLSPLKVWTLKKFLERWLISISLFSFSTCLMPSSFSRTVPSPCSSMSFSNSNLGFFSTFTFLTDTSWNGKVGKNFLCFFQCCLESMYFLNYLFMYVVLAVLVFIATLRLSLVAASGGYSPLQRVEFLIVAASHCRAEALGTRASGVAECGCQ